MTPTTTEPIDRTSVREALWTAIGYYKRRGLNIIENPSVGTLEADDEVCALITHSLGALLRHCFLNKTLDDRIRVLCTLQSTAIYKLQVTGTGPLIVWYHAIGRELFGKWATDIGCTLRLEEVEGGDPVITLLFPVPSV